MAPRLYVFTESETLITPLEIARGVSDSDEAAVEVATRLAALLDWQIEVRLDHPHQVPRYSCTPKGTVYRHGPQRGWVTGPLV